MGHEYVGFVEEVGPEVTAVKPGGFVVGSFATSGNVCANGRNGFLSSCLNVEFLSTCQAEYAHNPKRAGTLVAARRCRARSSALGCWQSPMQRAPAGDPQTPPR